MTDTRLAKQIAESPAAFRRYARIPTSNGPRVLADVAADFQLADFLATDPTLCQFILQRFWNGSPPRVKPEFRVDANRGIHVKQVIHRHFRVLLLAISPALPQLLGRCRNVLRVVAYFHEELFGYFALLGP